MICDVAWGEQEWAEWGKKKKDVQFGHMMCKLTGDFQEKSERDIVHGQRLGLK